MFLEPVGITGVPQLWYTQLKISELYAQLHEQAELLIPPVQTWHHLAYLALYEGHVVFVKVCDKKLIYLEI